MKETQEFLLNKPLKIPVIAIDWKSLTGRDFCGLPRVSDAWRNRILASFWQAENPAW